MLLLLSIANFYVGGISSDRSPCLSLKFPGLLSAFEENPKISKSIGQERKILIPGSINLTITLSKKKISKLNYRDDNYFLRFYSDNQTVRAKFFDWTKGIYTHYHLNQNGGHLVSVDSTDPVDIATTPIFPFIVTIHNTTKDYKKMTPLSNQFTAKYIVILLIAYWLLYYIVNQMSSSFLFYPSAEVWRFDMLINNRLFYMTFGTAIVTCAIYCIHLKPKSLMAATCPSLVVAVFLRTAFTKVFDMNYFESDYIGPALAFVTFFMTPLCCYDVVMNFFGSFRGISFFMYPVVIGFYVLIAMVLSYSISLVTMRMITRAKFDYTRGQSKFITKKQGFFFKVYGACYIVSSAYIIRPCIDHLLDVVFNDAPIDLDYISKIVIIYGLYAAIVFTIRAFIAIKTIRGQWGDGLESDHLILSAAMIVYLLYYLYSHSILSLSSVFKMGTLIVMLFPVVMSIGAGMGFGGAVPLLIQVFESEKIN